MQTSHRPDIDILCIISNKSIIFLTKIYLYNLIIYFDVLIEQKLIAWKHKFVFMFLEVLIVISYYIIIVNRTTYIN